MGKSKIEWTDETWNPIVGCSVLSAGCTNCYAMEQAARIVRMQPDSHYSGLTKKVNGKHVWTGDIATASDKVLTAPLRWQRPRMVFVNSMGDLFHEGVTDEQIDRVFAIMALTPQHTYQILTKRPERMRDYFAARYNNHTRGMKTMAEARIWQQMIALTYPRSIEHPAWPLPNVWLGVSVEDQRSADERIKYLVDTPAALHFISAEPLLGPVDLTSVAAERYAEEDEWSRALDWRFNCLRAGDDYFADEVGTVDGPIREGRIRFVICGGESGDAARPMHPDWARKLRNQCAEADDPTAFFFKQWGAWAPGNWALNTDDVLTFYPLDESMDLVRANSVSSGCEHWWDESSLPEGLGAYRRDKARSGRLLDGKEHSEMPNV